MFFIGHFVSVLGYQFGNEVLPTHAVKWIDRYSVPWFYQNYYMFAPDPTYHINTFLYRVETESGWSQWKDPSFSFLYDHWNNRFWNASDNYDMFYGLSEALFDGVHFMHFREHSNDSDWFLLPAHNAAERYILLNSDYADSTIHAFQVGVMTEHHYFDADHSIQDISIFQPYPIKFLGDD